MIYREVTRLSQSCLSGWSRGAFLCAEFIKVRDPPRKANSALSKALLWPLLRAKQVRLMENRLSPLKLDGSFLQLIAYFLDDAYDENCLRSFCTFEIDQKNTSP